MGSTKVPVLVGLKVSAVVTDSLEVTLEVPLLVVVTVPTNE
jgi:hypothetical protein